MSLLYNYPDNVDNIIVKVVHHYRSCISYILNVIMYNTLSKA